MDAVSFRSAYRLLVTPVPEESDEEDTDDSEDEIKSVKTIRSSQSEVIQTLVLKHHVITAKDESKDQLRRPLLDLRMPTLVTKAAFALPALEDMPPIHKKLRGLKRLEANPPRSLRDLRNIITSELTSVGKKLSRLERSYYGVGKSVQHEVDKYAMPIKGVMRMLTIFDMSSVTAIENAIKLGSDPKRYKGDPNNITLLKEAYAKVLTYVPDKFNEIIEFCNRILVVLEKYFVSFYDSDSDVYLETASHYEEQLRTWQKSIRGSLERVHKLQRDFKNGMIHFSMFTPPVTTFCKRNECENVPFILIFADACTNIRAVMSVLKTWLQADENYPVFLRNDIDDMEKHKEDKVKLMRESKQRYHAVTYKLNQSEMEYEKAASEVDNMKEKEEALQIEADYLINLNAELQSELEFKVFRRDELKKNMADVSPESFNETFDMLTDEIRFVKDRLPLVKRQLAAAQFKLEWMTEKKACVAKIEKELQQLRRDANDVDHGRQQREDDVEKLIKALELARRIHRYKTSTDVAEKIYFCLPIEHRQRVQALQSLTPREDTLSKVCMTLAQYVDLEWMDLYRELPFFPKRGKQTIEKDISAISVESARGPRENRTLIALNRWRRHHTRAKTDDIMETLKRIKRLDILAEVDKIVNPPKIVEEVKETYVPPSVAPELVPFYREVERYDKLRAAHKVKTGRQ
ncbi:chromosome partition protein Smc-like isoform X3 [Argopecten irradians]|uniref:chromosome partition protein Smc-like isoform X3 n=2 Tax=Argopecten irradians TaxID=31199 RepID=UPI003717B359